MCTTVVAYDMIDGLTLLLLSNRDELYDRPARPAHVWAEDSGIVGGRDLRAGGTWLACSKRGKLANITNVREPGQGRPKARSRGRLVTAFLESDVSGPAFAHSVDGGEYEGFNMLAWDGNHLTYFSNRAEGVIRLEAGIHGMSNGSWDDEWPKVARARRRLSELIRRGDLSDDKLLGILLDSEEADEDELPDTGVPREWERTLSPTFISTQRYGTRCSTIVKLLAGGSISLDEHTHAPNHPCTSHRRLEFSIKY